MLLAQQYNNNINRNIINNNNNYNNRRRNNYNNRGNNSNNQGFGNNNKNFNNNNFNNFNNSNNNNIMGAGWDAVNRRFSRNNWPANVCSHTKPEYCWTHGCDAAHSSQECRQQAPGHQVQATRQNPMGGNNRNQERTILPQSRGLIGIPPRQQRPRGQGGQFQQQQQQQYNQQGWQQQRQQQQQANMGVQFPPMQPNMQYAGMGM